MKIIYLDKIDSTHKYLIENLKNLSLSPPIAISANSQSGGVGSRDNHWESIDGNLFFSFALTKDALPKDLPLSSLSIYFGYVMKIVLEENSSKVWIKWPNDFYINEKKIGGVISFLYKNIVVNSMGINMLYAPKNFDILDIKIPKNRLLNDFFSKLELSISWKQIFSKYSVEFQKSRDYKFNQNNQQILLKDAKLLEDASISINDKRIYNLR